METDDAKRLRVQDLLFQARKLLAQAGELCDELGETVFFMGLAYEPSFGWFSRDGGLQEGSDWNHSDCVIGSLYAEGYGMEGWKTAPRAENLDDWQQCPCCGRRREDHG